MKKKGPIDSIKKAIIDMDGATCSSCVYTIEHVGRKFEGVVDCYVNRETSQIQVEYDGNGKTLDKIVELVDRIGYTAAINNPDV